MIRLDQSALRASTPALYQSSVSFSSLPYADIPSLSWSVDPKWLNDLRDQVHRIYGLRHDWDGYGAGPIRRDVLAYALEILERIMERTTPTPHITPMSNEGIILEWHEGDIDFEIEISTPGEAWVAYAQPNAGIDREWRVKADLRSLESPIKTITGQTAYARTS